MPAVWDHGSIYSGGDITPERLTKALGYPFWSPESSFVLNTSTGSLQQVPDEDAADLLPGRTPALAIGSNAAPEHLRWKFADRFGDPLVVATTVRITDFEVVYAAHLSRYGSVPATMVRAPGTTVQLKLLWSTPEQTALMHQSESLGADYAIAQVDRANIVTSETVGAFLNGHEHLEFYEALAGPLRVGGSPVALSAIRAQGRGWRAKDQREMLTLLAEAADYHSIEQMLGVTTAAAGPWEEFNRRMREDELL